MPGATRAASRVERAAIAGLALATSTWTALATGSAPASATSADSSALSGNVTFNSDPGPLVNLSFALPQGGYEGAQTAADGSYTRDTSTWNSGEYGVQLQLNNVPPQQPSTPTSVPTSFVLNSTTPLTYSGTSAHQDYRFTTHLLTIVVRDSFGRPVQGRPVSATNVSDTAITTSDGTVGFTLPRSLGSSDNVTDANGTAVVSVLDGTTNAACVQTGYVDPALPCAAPVAVTSDTTVEIDEPPQPTISGVVRFNADPGQQVSLSFGLPQGGSEGAQTAADGTYARPAGYWSAGDYTVQIGLNSVPPQQSVTPTAVPTAFLLNSTTRLTYAGSSAQQDYHFTTHLVTIVVKDSSGRPVRGRPVAAYNPADEAITTSDGSIGFTLVKNFGQSNNITDSNGTAQVSVLNGTTDNICVQTGYIVPDRACVPAPITITSDTTVEIDEPAPPTISGSISINGHPIPTSSTYGPDIEITDYDGTPRASSPGLSSSYSANMGPVFSGQYGMRLQYFAPYPSFDSASNDTPNSFLLTTAPIFNYNYANITQNVALQTKRVAITVTDAHGQPTPAQITATNLGASTLTTTDGSITFNVVAGYEQSLSTASSSGTTTISVFPGATYSICAQRPDSLWCRTLYVGTDTSVTLSPLPDVPSNLSVPTPTQTPTLTWTAAQTAQTYNIYRDGNLLGTSTTPDYTDTSATPGQHTYYVTAVNSAGESGPSNTAAVQVGFPPAITSSAVVTTGRGAPVNFTIMTSGSPAPSLSYSGTLPAGLSFHDNADGTASITGAVSATAAVGPYPIRVTATNGIGTPATQNLTLSVNYVTLTSPTTATAAYGSAFTLTVSATGTPTPTLSESGTLPPGITFSAHTDGTATLSGTPNGTASGAYSVTITAKNKQQTVTQTLVFTVTRPASLPTLANRTATVGSPYTQTITATGSPTPSFTVTGLPAGLTAGDAGNGILTISGTPQSGAGGAYQVSVTAVNSFGSATRAFTLTVTQAPQFTSLPSASATVGSAFTFQVTATGTPTPTLSIAGALPAGITFKAGTGVLAGTPRSGTAGTYSLAFTAKNSAGSIKQTFTFTVS